MREDLLHFIWKYKKLQLTDLVTTSKKKVSIESVGTHNHFAGPDFFNAKVSIDGQLWAGNVEIHLKSSDWYAHNHEQDANYNNVILHVVWQDDGDVFRSDNSKIPTLELKNYISKELLAAYAVLFDKKEKTFINCEKDIADVDGFMFNNWIERLFFERLERKSNFIFELLENSQNDWEQVLFTMLLKNFGLKINGQAFLSLANALNFSVVRKLRTDVSQLESVFFGMSNLLDEETIVDEYFIDLKKEYHYQKNKFDLKEESVQKPEFFKLRPPNFPTIRLSQLANLYGNRHNLFSLVIDTYELNELYKILDSTASEYWSEHFTFGKTSKRSAKKTTKKFIDLLLVNTILPLKFAHAKQTGKDRNEQIMRMISQLKNEENTIISNFQNHGVKIKSAGDSQGFLQLYNEYCTKNKCLQCAVGSSLLNRNS